MCRICDAEYFESTDNMLFGTEDEPDARFLCLTDCEANCVLEVSGLDRWIETEMQSARIGLPRCPRYRTPIMYGTPKP